MMKHWRAGGFTLTEFVLVIILVGILSAAVLMINMNSTGQHSVTVQADELRRNLSHIQLLAISRGKRLRLTVNVGGGSYTVTECNDSACAAPVALIDPATGQNFSVTMKDGVTLASTNSPLDFDSLGRPQFNGALIAAANTFTVTGSGRTVTVAVLPITGFARTTY